MSALSSRATRLQHRFNYRAWLVLRHVNAVAAHLPLLAAKERIYDTDFFELTDFLQEEMYGRLAESIYARLQPHSAVDIGCGTGQILAVLASHGVEIRGVDGSRHAIARSRVSDSIIRCDLERGVPDLGRFDVAICTEVAEHLPARAARPLVEGLARLGERVLFTAAAPGQSNGTHHINEQPREYWLELFAERGLQESPLTEMIRADIAGVSGPEWMDTNLMLLERAADTTA